MAKRKRDISGKHEDTHPYPRKALKSAADPQKTPTDLPNEITIQIVTGSYERVLQGVTATISGPYDDGESSQSIQFADTFLFHAHASAIRCLALGPLPDDDPSPSQKLVLASGGTDERINLYT